MSNTKIQERTVISTNLLSYFQSLRQHQCTVDVQLKMNVKLSGKLKYVDRNLLMMLQMQPKERQKLPKKFSNLGSEVFIRGSTFRQIQMPKIQKDIRLIQQTIKRQK